MLIKLALVSKSNLRSSRKLLWAAMGAGTVGGAAVIVSRYLINDPQEPHQFKLPGQADGARITFESLQSNAAHISASVNMFMESKYLEVESAVYGAMAGWLANVCEQKEGRQFLLDVGGLLLLDTLIDWACDDLSAKQAAAETAVVRLLQSGSDASAVLSHSGYLSRLLLHCTSGKASEELQSTLENVPDLLDFFPVANLTDVQVLLQLVRGRHGISLQPLAARFLAAWAAASPANCSTLTAAGVHRALAEVATTAASGRGGVEARKLLTEVMRAMAVIAHISGVGHVGQVQHMHHWVEPILYMAADAVALQDTDLAHLALTLMTTCIQRGGNEVCHALQCSNVLPLLQFVAKGPTRLLHEDAASLVGMLAKHGMLPELEADEWMHKLLSWLAAHDSEQTLKQACTEGLAGLASMPGHVSLKVAHYWLGHLLDLMTDMPQQCSIAVAAADAKPEGPSWKPVPIAYVRWVSSELRAAADSLAGEHDAPPEMAGLLDPAALAMYPVTAKAVDAALADATVCTALEVMCTMVAEDPNKQQWLQTVGVLPLLHRLVVQRHKPSASMYSTTTCAPRLPPTAPPTLHTNRAPSSPNSSALASHGSHPFAATSALHSQHVTVVPTSRMPQYAQPPGTAATPSHPQSKSAAVHDLAATQSGPQVLLIPSRSGSQLSMAASLHCRFPLNVGVSVHEAASSQNNQSGNPKPLAGRSLGAVPGTMAPKQSNQSDQSRVCTSCSFSRNWQNMTGFLGAAAGASGPTLVPLGFAAPMHETHVGNVKSIAEGREHASSMKPNGLDVCSHGDRHSTARTDHPSLRGVVATENVDHAPSHQHQHQHISRSSVPNLGRVFGGGHNSPLPPSPGYIQQRACTYSADSSHADSRNIQAPPCSSCTSSHSNHANSRDGSNVHITCTYAYPAVFPHSAPVNATPQAPPIHGLHSTPTNATRPVPAACILSPVARHLNHSMNAAHPPRPEAHSSCHEARDPHGSMPSAMQSVLSPALGAFSVRAQSPNSNPRSSTPDFGQLYPQSTLTSAAPALMSPASPSLLPAFNQARSSSGSGIRQQIDSNGRGRGQLQQSHNSTTAYSSRGAGNDSGSTHGVGAAGSAEQNNSSRSSLSMGASRSISDSGSGISCDAVSQVEAATHSLRTSRLGASLPWTWIARARSHAFALSLAGPSQLIPWANNCAHSNSSRAFDNPIAHHSTSNRVFGDGTANHSASKGQTDSTHSKGPVPRGNASTTSFSSNFPRSTAPQSNNLLASSELPSQTAPVVPCYSFPQVSFVPQSPHPPLNSLLNSHAHTAARQLAAYSTPPSALNPDALHPSHNAFSSSMPLACPLGPASTSQSISFLHVPYALASNSNKPICTPPGNNNATSDVASKSTGVSLILLSHPGHLANYYLPADNMLPSVRCSAGTQDTSVPPVLDIMHGPIISQGLTSVPSRKEEWGAKQNQQQGHSNANNSSSASSSSWFSWPWRKTASAPSSSSTSTDTATSTSAAPFKGSIPGGRDNPAAWGAMTEEEFPDEDSGGWDEPTVPLCLQREAARLLAMLTVQHVGYDTLVGSSWLEWLWEASGSSDCQLSSNAARALLHLEASRPDAPFAPCSPGACYPSCHPLFLDGVHLLSPGDLQHWYLAQQPDKRLETAINNTLKSLVDAFVDVMDFSHETSHNSSDTSKLTEGGGHVAGHPSKTTIGKPSFTTATIQQDTLSTSDAAGSAVSRGNTGSAVHQAHPTALASDAIVTAELSLPGVISEMDRATISEPTIPQAPPSSWFSFLSWSRSKPSGAAIDTAITDTQNAPQKMEGRSRHDEEDILSTHMGSPAPSGPVASGGVAPRVTGEAMAVRDSSRTLTPGVARGVDSCADLAGAAATAAVERGRTTLEQGERELSIMGERQGEQGREALERDERAMLIVGGLHGEQGEEALEQDERTMSFVGELQGEQLPARAGMLTAGTMKGHGAAVTRGAVLEEDEDGNGACVGGVKGRRAVGPPLMDIVFIHGIRGGPFMTWRKEKNAGRSNMTWEDCWVSNWLIQDVPNARFLSLGYPAPFTSWEVESAPLKETSMRLMQKLAAAGVGQRPVVFVVHSMGGLIVKEILVHLMQEGPSSLYYNLFRETRAIAFYATPHFGSTYAALGWKLGVKPAPSIEHLVPGPHLIELNAAMRRLHSAGQLRVLNFVEGQATQVARVIPKLHIVPLQSGYPGFGELVMLPDQDHIDACKPRSCEAPGYAYLLRLIWRVMAEVAKEQAARQREEDVEFASAAG